MKLSKVTIDEIKQKSGLDFETVKDYVAFADMIYDVTGRRLGVTTLKRLFGNIEDERNPILYTLNTIAIYLGYESWEKYNSQKDFDSDYDYNDDSVYISQLHVGTKIKVSYLNRIVTFIVIPHENIKALKVLNSVNSSLKEGDIVILYRLKKGECIEATQVIRGRSIGNYTTKGEINELIVEEP